VETAGLVQVVEVPADADEEVLGELASQVQASLDVVAGPVVRVAVLDRGVRGQLVLVVAHHLVIDAVSWPALVEDLSSAYEQVAAGVQVRLPGKTASYGAWTARLAELASSAEVAAEAGYWQEVLDRVAPLPVDFPGVDVAGVNSVASSGAVRARLAAEPTERLLREVPAAFGVQINEVLLAALGRVLAGWAGVPAVVDVESHGRHDVGVDVSRTVGWFTSVSPVPLVADADPGAAVREMKERLRGVPRGGLGYGLLRYMAGALAGPGPQVAFNYLSQPGLAGGGQGQGQSQSQSQDQQGQNQSQDQDRAAGPPVRLRARAGTLGRQYSLAGDREHVLEVTAWVAGGRLVTSWVYGNGVHGRATISTLAEAFIKDVEVLVEFCCGPGAGGYSPSDFPMAGLDQGALDAIRARFDAAQGGGA
jgi:non-ribosomal peptide synthase protein (TIGR01720 family)